MSEHESSEPRFARLRVFAFRVFGGVLLAFSVFGLGASCVGVYYTIVESSISGWLPPFLVGIAGVACAITAVVGVRALRVKSVADIEEQGKSEWLEI